VDYSTLSRERLSRERERGSLLLAYYKGHG
jgi:hypothetical protein